MRRGIQAESLVYIEQKVRAFPAAIPNRRYDPQEKWNGCYRVWNREVSNSAYQTDVTRRQVWSVDDQTSVYEDMERFWNPWLQWVPWNDLGVAQLKCWYLHPEGMPHSWWLCLMAYPSRITARSLFAQFMPVHSHSDHSQAPIDSRSWWWVI